jgi:hypothetical protein
VKILGIPTASRTRPASTLRRCRGDIGVIAFEVGLDEVPAEQASEFRGEAEHGVGIGGHDPGGRGVAPWGLIGLPRRTRAGWLFLHEDLRGALVVSRAIDTPIVPDRAVLMRMRRGVGAP